MAVGVRQSSIVVLCLTFAGCSSTARNTAIVTTTTARPRTACATPSRFGTDANANEVRGVTTTGQLWGLALGPGHIPPRAGEELKIVWRMTGTGPLRIAFTAPDGRARPLVFGPEPHTGSNYQRPGDEWGTGFRFSAPGCWHIHFARDDTTGDVWLTV